MPSLADKVADMMARTFGDAPEVLANTREFFKQLNDVIHYYLDKFGPYMAIGTRKDLAKLALEADQIYVELEGLWYELVNIEGLARTLARLKREKEFVIPDEQRERIVNKVYAMEEKVKDFHNKVLGIIGELIRIVEREGIE